ncbi:MAG: type II toxin-antitoxin system RelE/ParE family toxin [Desulfobacterales bacterium]|nr:type II toxin-antitoxin system RelE/ParE family toxin [Desulfobacterales bacterium]
MSKVARRKLRQLEIANHLEDLRIPPGNHLEALKGSRAGQYSIRINDQWRICFRWSNGFACEGCQTLNCELKKGSSEFRVHSSQFRVQGSVEAPKRKKHQKEKSTKSQITNYKQEPSRIKHQITKHKFQTSTKSQ